MHIKNLVMIGFVLAVGAMTVSVQGAPVIDQDFDALLAGDYNEASDVGSYDTNPGPQFSVVDGASDPFVGAGNSLRLYGSNDIRMRYGDVASISGAGSFSVDFNVTAGQFTANLVPSDGANIAVQIAANNRYGATNPLRYGSGDINVNFDQTVSPGTNYTLAIDFDTGTDTFSGTNKWNDFDYQQRAHYIISLQICCN